MANNTEMQQATAKVKQEKIDPEIEAKIKLLKGDLKSEKQRDNTANLVKNTDTEHNGNLAATESAADANTSDEDDEDEEDHETEQQDEKKKIEPLKSSNEILAELFKVFNAAPPQELLNDKKLIEKVHKHKKHKKEKKKKRKKSKSPAHQSDSEASTPEAHKSNGHRHKKKKKREKKHKEDRARSREHKRREHVDHLKIKVEDTSVDKPARHYSNDAEVNKNLVTDARVSFKLRKENKQLESNKAAVSNEKSNRNGLEKSKNSFYNGYDEHLEIKKENGDNRQKPNKNEIKDDDISEISLSDEETYLREKEQLHNTAETKRARYEQHDFGKNSHSNNYKRSSNSFYDGAERTHSREDDKDKRYYRHSTRRHHRSRTRSRSRSKSRSRSVDLGIDKKRLLEIARKNAISMFKRGNLPGSANMSEEVRDKVLMKMRYGGRTVQDLTEFCKKISNGENLSELSSDEDSDVDKQGNTKAFHHPFQVKEREPIVMHIRNATTIVPRKPAEDQTKAITMQFPVSSGQHHRLTEAAWVPVEPREKLPPLPALPQASQATTIFKSAKTKNVFEKPIPKQAHQEPAFKALHMPNDTPMLVPAASDALSKLPLSNSTTAVVAPINMPLVNFSVPPPPIPKPIPTVAPPAIPAHPAFVPDVPIPSSAQTATPKQPVDTHQSIFPGYQQNSYDVATIITKRLNAMRRLQENPKDPEALQLMNNSQQQMTSWAASKHLPGEFTGSTGAKMLSVQELSAGPQVWTRRNQMTSSKPVSGGMGMHLLQKMGWKPGEGLGREKTGSLQPLLLDVKLDKRGLVSKEDNSHNRPQVSQRKRPKPLPQEDVQHKHPVSVLNEMSSKNKWQPPIYQVVNETGPMHNKMVLFSVTMNGVTYTPDRGSSTKKQAKMIAARYCLQEMGFIPKAPEPAT